MVIAENRIRHRLGSRRSKHRREGIRVSLREGEVVVIVRQVLGVDRKAQELIVLIADPGDPALEVCGM
jgi:hypothetical protein